MALKIEENFEVQAPIAQVWAYLTNPEQVVVCLPGAELTETRDDGSFEGRIRVKVGPVTARYNGTARFEETDAAEHRMRMAGEGRETGGSGSARMNMTSTMTELSAGVTQVRVEAEVDVVGKIVQFGRGLMEEVSRQLFKQFATCVQTQLAQADEAGAAPDAAAPAPGDESAAAPPVPNVAPVASGGVASAMPAAAAMAAAAVGAPLAAAPTRAPAPARAARPRAAPRPHAAARPKPSTPPAGDGAVSALPLLIKAVGAMARRFVGRIFGRSGRNQS